MESKTIKMRYIECRISIEIYLSLTWNLIKFPTWKQSILFIFSLAFSWKLKVKRLRFSWHRGTSSWPTCSSILLGTSLLYQSGNSFITSICSRSSSWIGCIMMKAKVVYSWRSVTLSSSKHRCVFQKRSHFLRNSLSLYYVKCSGVKGISVCLLLQDQLELLVRDNEQLKSEVRELLNSSALASSSLDRGKVSIGITI